MWNAWPLITRPNHPLKPLMTNIWKFFHVITNCLIGDGHEVAYNGINFGTRASSSTFNLKNLHFDSLAAIISPDAPNASPDDCYLSHNQKLRIHVVELILMKMCRFQQWMVTIWNSGKQHGGCSTRCQQIGRLEIAQLFAFTWHCYTVTKAR